MGDEKQGRPITIVELQPYRETSSIELKSARDEEGRATLMNLNPNVNAWYQLRVKRPGSRVEETYHLENADPRTQRLRLDKSTPNGLLLMEGEKRPPCDLWGTDSRESLEGSRKSRIPYAALCDSKLYLRNPTKGHQTPIETVTDFLRKKFPVAKKSSLLSVTRSLHIFTTRRRKDRQNRTLRRACRERKESDDGPAPALLDPQLAGRLLKPNDLGIQIQESSRNGMIPGTWYDAEDNSGIYVSVIVPNGIAPEIMRSYKNVVNRSGHRRINSACLSCCF